MSARGRRLGVGAAAVACAACCAVPLGALAAWLGAALLVALRPGVLGLVAMAVGSVAVAIRLRRRRRCRSTEVPATVVVPAPVRRP